MKHHQADRGAIRGMAAGLGVTVVVAAVVVLFASAAPGLDEPREDYGQVRVGESLFLSYCISCHGPTAEGDGPLAESLRVTPANLTLIRQRNGGEFDMTEVRKKIDGREEVKGHGSSDMPVWGEVFTKLDESATEEQVRDKVTALSHFIRSLQAL